MRVYVIRDKEVIRRTRGGLEVHRKSRGHRQRFAGRWWRFRGSTSEVWGSNSEKGRSDLGGLAVSEVKCWRSGGHEFKKDEYRRSGGMNTDIQWSVGGHNGGGTSENRLIKRLTD